MLVVVVVLQLLVMLVQGGSVFRLMARVEASPILRHLCRVCIQLATSEAMAW